MKPLSKQFFSLLLSVSMLLAISMVFFNVQEAFAFNPWDPPDWYDYRELWPEFEVVDGEAHVVDTYVTTMGNGGVIVHASSLVIPETYTHTDGETYPVTKICSGALDISQMDYWTDPDGVTISIPASVLEIEQGALCGDRITRIKIDSNNPALSTKNYVLYNKDKTQLLGVLLPRASYWIEASVTHVSSGALADLSDCTIGFWGDAPVFAEDACLNANITIQYDGCEPWAQEVLQNYGGNIQWDTWQQHTYGNIVVTVLPTCQTEGTQTMTCTKCGEEGTEAIPKLMHTPTGVITVVTAPTCTKIGSGTQICGMCKQAVQVNIPATGHTYVDYECHCGKHEFLGYTVNEDRISCTIDYANPPASITEYDIPEKICGYTVTRLGDRSFAIENFLTAVTIPDTVTTIEEGVFGSCDNLKSVTIPDSVTTIGDYAFNYCTSLEEIVIPDSVTEIGSLFSKCTSLKKVTIGSGVKELSNPYVFSECPALEELYLDCEIVESYGLWKLDGLKTLYLGENVKTVVTTAQICTRALVKIVVDENNPYLVSDNYGALYDRDQTKVIMVPPRIDETYQLPETVTTIGKAAFYACYSPAQLAIGANVQSIEESAFYYSDVNMIAFRGNAPTIADHAFFGVTAEVYYPSGNVTYTEEVMQNYSGKLTWAHYCLKHTYEESVTTEPTCTEEGVKTLSCIYCDKVKTQAISATGHDYVDGKCECGALERINGDVNGDGKLNMGDVAKLFAAVRMGTDLDMTIADVTGDGKLNMGDVAKLLARIGKEEMV